jgi:N-acetylneuraminic acid mutarotase
MKKNLRKIIVIVLYLTLPMLCAAQGDWKIISPTYSPLARYGHSLTPLPNENIFLFGGQESAQKMYNDLHSYNNGQWTPVTPDNNAPPERSNHCAWYLNGKLYVQGGVTETQGPLNDLWNYDPVTKEWTMVNVTGNKPSARYNHDVAQNTDGSVVLSGGMDGSNLLDDMWRYDPITGEWTPFGTLPAGMSNHITLIVDNKLYVFYNSQGYAYDLSTSTWTSGLQAPAVNFGATCALGQNDQGHKIIFVFGGYGNSGYSDIVFEYNTATGAVSQQTTTMPVPVYQTKCARLGSSKEYDHLELVFFGGVSGSWSNMVPMDQTWEYELGALNVNEYEAQGSMKVYPNPAGEELYFMLPQNYSEADVEILDITGRVVWRQQGIKGDRILTDFLSPSVYILKVSAGNKIYVEKVIVKG